MPEDPESRRFRIKADITLTARDRAEAQNLAGSAVEWWSEETGWEHIQGIGGPSGSVIVEELEK